LEAEACRDGDWSVEQMAEQRRGKASLIEGLKKYRSSEGHSGIRRRKK
jgi:hypothetical protein